jgi:hypothetical protein
MNQLSYTVDCSKFVSRGFEFEGDFERSVAESIAKLKALNHAERCLQASL